MANKIEKKGVDEQGEQAETEDEKWQRQEHEKRTEHGIENSQQERGDDQIQRFRVVDAFYQINGHQHCQCVNQPALEKAPHNAAVSPA